MRSRFTLLALTAQVCVAALNAQDTAPARENPSGMNVGAFRQLAAPAPAKK